MKYETFTNEWVRLYMDEGLSFSEIAKRYNTTTRTVNRTLLGKVETRPKSKFEQFHHIWYDLYVNQGYNKQDIGQKYGTSASVVSKALEKLGIKPNSHTSKLKYLAFSKLWAGQYQSGMSLQEIADTVEGVTPETVRQYIEREGIETRSYSEAIRKHEFNEKCFDQVDGEMKAYILGLVYSSGSLIEDLNLHILNISCVEENRGIGDRIAQFIGESSFYYRKKPGGNTELTWRYASKHLFDRLHELGLGKRKGEDTSFPNLQSELYSSFILGFWEGHGTFPRESKPYISFSGTKGFLEALRAVLGEVADKSGMLIRQNQQYETHSLVIYRRDVWLPVLKWIYTDQTEYLDFRRPPFLGE